MSCCFSGHRKLPLNKIEYIIKNLDREIERLISQGVTDFISGGAIGFDTIAALLIIAKKNGGKNVRLIIALPCKNQDALWDSKQKSIYQNLLKEADEIVYVSENYSPSCMEKRNRYMVEHSTHCICALLHEKSGTAQTVRLARKRGIRIINTGV